MTKQAKVVIYRDASKRGDWRWSAVAENGRIVADSGEGYQNKQDCLAALLFVGEIVVNARRLVKRRAVTRASLRGTK